LAQNIEFSKRVSELMVVMLVATLVFVPPLIGT
jgi:hypothetical protein